MRKSTIALIWLVLVVACSMGVWAAIKQVGAATNPPAALGIQPMSTPKATPANPSASSPAPAIGTTPPAATQPEIPRATQATAPAPARPTTRRTPTAQRPPRASSPARPQNPEPAPKSPAAPGPVTPRPVTGSYQGAPGSVTAQCNGNTIALVGAQPNAGWRIEVDERGPGEVKVKFEQAGSQTEVKAGCSGGRPVFEVETGER